MATITGTLLTRAHSFPGAGLTHGVNGALVSRTHGFPTGLVKQDARPAFGRSRGRPIGYVPRVDLQRRAAGILRFRGGLTQRPDTLREANRDERLTSATDRQTVDTTTAGAQVVYQEANYASAEYYVFYDPGTNTYYYIPY